MKKAVKGLLKLIGGIMVAAGAVLENKDYLMRELNILIENLQKYELAMEQNDLPGLTALLYEGRRRKEEVDGH